jgi:hypothetical protein
MRRILILAVLAFALPVTAFAEGEMDSSRVVYTPQEGVEHFSYRAAFFSYFKKRGIAVAEKNTEYYIQNIYYDEYRQGWDNDFEKRRLMQRATQEIKEGLDNYDGGKVYFAIEGAQIERYDFEKGGFVMSDNTPYYSTDIGAAGDGRANVGAFGDGRFNLVAVFPNVMENYNFLKIDEDTAEAFLKSRTNWSGSIDMRVNVIITFRVGEFGDRVFTDFVRREKFFENYLINCVVQKVELYDSNSESVIGELTKR